MFTFDRGCSRLLMGALMVLALTMMISTAAVAQTITGSISGTITDSSNRVVVGASVTLLSDQTGATRTSTTGEEGRFTFAALQPGIYSLKVEQNGFQTLDRKGVVLSANENLALGDLLLTPGQVTETVTVTSESAVVERESSDLTARLTSDQIDLISTKGRDITSLLRLIPGTSNNDDIEAVGEGFGTDLPNISGQRGRSTVASIDGLNAAEPSGSNKLSMSINQDAVAEVKVLRNNYAAEYGNNGGALINIVSKGGGKDYRGTAYYFLRNEALNAASFFTNKAGLKKAIYRHNIWGFNYGGPLPLPRFGEGGSSLLRDKAFFFISIEKPHTISPTDPVFVTVPTALERQGDFRQSFTGFNATTGQPNFVTLTDPPRPPGTSPITNNIVPANRINPSGQALLNFFPLPNTPGGRTLAGTSYNYVFQKSVDVPKHSYVFRFDVKPTNNDSIYWKGQWFTSDNEGLGTSGWPGGDNNRWGISSHYLYKDNGWSANWVHIFSPSIVNEFNFGMRHDSEGFIPSDGVIETLTRSAVGYTAPQLFPDNNRLGTIPRATGWSGVAGTPANINWLDRWGEVGNDYIQPSFANNLSIIRGSHTFKFGAYYERLKNGEAPGGQWSGVFNFDNNSAFTTALGATGYPYANALLGNFRTYTESSARPFTNLTIKILQWYAQDEWKFNRRLTLNYGVRWSYHSPFTQVDRQGSNFDPRLYNPANAPLLYLPVCVSSGSNPAIVAPTGAACATANRRAIDPRSPNVFLTNTNLVGTFVRNPDGSVVGNINNGLALGVDPNTPEGYRITKPIDWEPRVGLAFALRDSTILRTMFGVYHSQRVGGGTTGGNLVNNPPANRSFTIGPCPGCNIDGLAGVLGTALNSPPTVNAVEVNSQTPTIYNFTLGIQQDIGFKSVMEISYVGSLARHLGERRNINQVPDNAHFLDLTGPGANCAVTTAGCIRNPFATVNKNGPHTTGVLGDNFLRPYKGFGDINMVMWSGTSNYNGLQVQVNRRYTRGFQYGIAYTFSKTFDYANDDSSDVNAGRPYKAFNYGPSDFNQKHIFTVNYIYDVPKLSKHFDNALVRAVFDNWQISGMTNYASGKPKTFGTGTGLNWAFNGASYTISTGQTYLATGQACAPGFELDPGSTTTCRWTGLTDFTGGDINARPVLLCDPNRNPGTFDATGSPHMIDIACFAKPGTPGAIGDLQRNLVRQQPIFNTDLAFFKNIRLGERRNIQLRFETYNLFNKANFSDINGSMTFAIDGAVSAVPTTGPNAGTCPAGTVLAYAAIGTTAPARCASSTIGRLSQTNSAFGTARAARSPRVMQASIRISF
ncbi:MAG: carboxypeptidase regulatory-like domain-containing protein [Pyrinomonadaceae bacterium]